MTLYRITRSTPAFGHQPGELVELNLTPSQEARHLTRGSLAIEWPSSNVARPVRPAGATAPRKRRRRSGDAGNTTNGGGK